jgi:guanine deaminase
MHKLVGVCDPDTEEGIGGLDLFGYSKMNEEMVEKWWCNGDDRNRKSVWVQGRRVRNERGNAGAM